LKTVFPVLKRLYKWVYFWLMIMVLATLVLHFVIVARPTDLILDEEYYVKEARSISENHSIMYTEHPPLGKLFIVAGTKIFGDNPLGWRFFSIFLGTTGIVFFYFICRKLSLSRRAASIATFLLAFENMTFVQNSVAMLDVFFWFFMLATFLLYLARRYVLAGIAVGLSMLSKLIGIMALPALVIHWFFSRVNRSRWFALTIILSFVVFFGLLPVLDSIIAHNFSTVTNPFIEIKNMVSRTASLTFYNTTHPSMARPWFWVVNYKTMPYWWEPHYISAISPSLWALIIPVFGYLIYKTIKRDDAGLFGLSWFAGTYLLWIPLSLITNRISYPYYFYPSVGAICLGLGMGLSQLIDIFQARPSGKIKWTVIVFVGLVIVAHLVSFMIFYPLFPIKFYS
jgi:dolichyl-phosphate-mannose-protein mannosyltransferase